MAVLVILAIPIAVLWELMKQSGGKGRRRRR